MTWSDENFHIQICIQWNKGCRNGAEVKYDLKKFGFYERIKNASNEIWIWIAPNTKLTTLYLHWFIYDCTQTFFDQNEKKTVFEIETNIIILIGRRWRNCTNGLWINYRFAFNIRIEIEIKLDDDDDWLIFRSPSCLFAFISSQSWIRWLSHRPSHWIINK